MPELIPRPPKIEGRGPTLATQNEIETILREVDEPISLNEVKRRMSAKAVDHRTVRLAIDQLSRFGLVVEGSKGVQWVPQASPQMRAAVLRGKSL